MKIVLLSGGSGLRLWPLSNGSRTKQFLKIIKNEVGQPESMVQRVWRQLSSVHLSEHAFIATSESQIDLIRNHIGDQVPIIVEPERRDTFPAIALTAAYLHAEAKVLSDEVICVLPVDPYVDASFFEKIKELESVIRFSDADIALIGSKPIYPSDKYGYMIPDENAMYGHKAVIGIKGFVEKPSRRAAEGLIAAGALWNCGVFAFKLGYILKLLQSNGYPCTYRELTNHYDKLPKISFDYEVVEKADRIAAVPYEGYWKDLGTWNTLTEEMDTSILGKGIMSEDSVNTHIVNELDIPVAVIGLSNVVIACSSDGIIATDKAASQRIKELVKQSEQTPRFEEMRWGWSTILDIAQGEDGNGTIVKKMVIKTGENVSSQGHVGCKKIWTVHSGKGAAVIDGKTYSTQPEGVLVIPSGAPYRVIAITELTLIEIQTGALNPYTKSFGTV